MKPIKFLILLFLTILLNGSCRINWQDALIYYIPYGYRGSLVIIFDQKNGQEKEYEGDRRVYRFDQNGILLTQFPIDLPGVRSQDEIFYIKDNEKIAIREISNSEHSTMDYTENYEKDKNEIFFIHPFAGGRASKRGGVNVSFIGNYYDYKRLDIGDSFSCGFKLGLVSTKITKEIKEIDISTQYSYQEILEIKNSCYGNKKLD